MTGWLNLFWLGSDNVAVSMQTQTGLVLALGEKIFRNGELAVMQSCFHQMQQAVPHSFALDTLNQKSDQLLTNGWSSQAYMDWMALSVFGLCLAHVSKAGDKYLSTPARIQITEYIRNKDKASSRVKMLLKGVTKLGTGHG